MRYKHPFGSFHYSYRGYSGETNIVARESGGYGKTYSYTGDHMLSRLFRIRGDYALFVFYFEMVIMKS
jgi:hypothetical protein